jgi:endonuclease III
MSTSSSPQILDAIIDSWWRSHAKAASGPSFASDREAEKLVRENLFAFLLAASIDRGGNAFALWNIPCRLKQEWGHLDPERIQVMAPEVLAADPVIAHAPSQVSRYQLAKTIISLAQVVQTQYGGSPERMLEGSVSDIMDSLQRVFGIGPNIARMIIILRILYFELEPERRGRLLPKLDVHVQRVLERAGLVSAATDESVGQLLADRSMRDIAVIDQACWDIGRRHCRPNDPKCEQCPVARCCPKIGIASSKSELGSEVARKRRRARQRNGPTFVFTYALPPGMTVEEARERCVEAISALLAEAPSRRNDDGISP